MKPVVLDGRNLTPTRLARVAAGAAVRLDPDALDRMDVAARWYARRGDEPVLRRKWAQLVGPDVPEDEAALVRAFVVGHCAGVGDPMPPDLVRATLAARCNVLLTGATGARPELAHLLAELLARDVLPVMPSEGGVGAAGDPALAHLARVAFRFGGEAWRDGRRLPAEEAMAGLPPFVPTQKEVLALLNGATPATATAALACARARRLLRTAEAACALSFEVVRADPGCLSELAMESRRHPGPIAVAARLRDELAGSELVAPSDRPDPFSVRCAPAVLGTVRDALDHVEATITRELNASIDNPLVFPALEVVEAGAFHAAPVALAMDHLKVALTQVASIAERRIFRMTYGQLSGLPSYLVPSDGLNSGLMLAQYTAASLVSECRGLAVPVSVHSIPTVQHHEDHVPMAPAAARGALAICEAVADVLAIELLCGAQGLDFHTSGQAVDADGRVVAVPPRRPGKGTSVTRAAVRARVRRWEEDRVLHPDLEALGQAVREGVFCGGEGAW